MVVVTIQRLKGGVLTSASSAQLSITTPAGATIIGPLALAPVSTGVYSYDYPALSPGKYVAAWTFFGGNPAVETILRPFTVDAAVEVNAGVTLMEIERWVARKIGPYRKLKVGTTSSPSAIQIPRLQSNILSGEYEDRYLLRRGFTTTDDFVQYTFNDDDRVRQVSAYDNIAGTLAVDRSYTVTPVSTESVELHALDPEDELREAVKDSLKRCFFWDMVTIDVTGSGVYNINVSSSVAWIRDVNQIREVSLSYPSQLLPPTRMGWWQPYRDGKDVKLYTKGGSVGSVTIQALRPVYSLVNGVESYQGPNDDLDMLYVDIEYAGWAGVLECWKNYPEVLQPLATQSMRPTRQEAAQEFTKKSLTLVQQVPDTRQIDYGRADIVQIGNLAEPVT